MQRLKRDPGDLPIIGWREWVALPSLGITAIKAKIDTGARSSALHAFDLEAFERDGRPMVRFSIHPHQRSARQERVVEAQVVEHRRIRSSSGHEDLRPVILTEVELLGRRIQTELTLTNRDAMGFRMLLGRQALRGDFVVDPDHSFLGGRKGTGARKRKRNRTAETDRKP